MKNAIRISGILFGIFLFFRAADLCNATGLTEKRYGDYIYTVSESKETTYDKEDGKFSQKTWKTATIKEYSGDEEEVTIPKKLGGVEVAELAHGLFQNKNAQRVLLPSTIRTFQVDTFPEETELVFDYDTDPQTVNHENLSTEDGYASLDDLRFIFSDNQVYITKYIGQARVAEIPEKICGRTVTRLMQGAIIGTTLKEIQTPTCLSEIEPQTISKGVLLTLYSETDHPYTLGKEYIDPSGQESSEEESSEEEPSTEDPEEEQKAKEKSEELVEKDLSRKKFLSICAIIVSSLIVLAVGGILYFQKREKN